MRSFVCCMNLSTGGLVIGILGITLGSFVLGAIALDLWISLLVKGFIVAFMDAIGSGDLNETGRDADDSDFPYDDYIASLFCLLLIIASNILILGVYKRSVRMIATSGILNTVLLLGIICTVIWDSQVGQLDIADGILIGFTCLWLYFLKVIWDLMSEMKTENHMVIEGGEDLEGLKFVNVEIQI